MNMPDHKFSDAFGILANIDGSVMPQAGIEPVMQITLPPEAQAIVEREVASGRFASEADVIVEALLQLEGETPHVDEELLITAHRQAEQGEGRPFTESVMKELLDRARSLANQGEPLRDDIAY
jgi:Arc/MetJ-type ribon-helix-helix transcriptional regulator